jgi:hypothetical protein
LSLACGKKLSPFLLGCVIEFTSEESGRNKNNIIFSPIHDSNNNYYYNSNDDHDQKWLSMSMRLPTNLGKFKKKTPASIHRNDFKSLYRLLHVIANKHVVLHPVHHHAVNADKVS